MHVKIDIYHHAIISAETISRNNLKLRNNHRMRRKRLEIKKHCVRYNELNAKPEKAHCLMIFHSHQSENKLRTYMRWSS